MATQSESLSVPYRDPITDGRGSLSNQWFNFLRSLVDMILPLGIERSFTLANNVSSPADVEGMKVNARAVSMAIVEFLVQRVTTGGSAVETVEAGSFILSYNPTALDWNISLTHINAPDNSGVDFTVASTGQVKYTSTNIGGDPSISRVVWRMRTLAAKSAQYSSAGAT